MSLKFLMAGPLLLTGCSLITTPATIPVTPGEAAAGLERFSGRWHVLAADPRHVDRDGQALLIEFRIEPEGTIRERWHAMGRAADSIPEITGERRWVPRADDDARWRADRWWPFSRDERHIVFISADNRHAVLGGKHGRPALILSRDPRVPEWTYTGLVARLAAAGYDVSTLRRIPAAR
jgi:lipocalin